VINTDTKHSAGKSEALLIDQGAYYRVFSSGNKVLLFKEENHFSNSIADKLNFR
jgi:hypothetical protein